MAREHLLKIGVAGIRGVVGDFLTPALALAFGQAFGTYVGRGKVVVGRDTRSSGPMLQHAVQCGLLAAGCEVADVGVLATPTLQMFIADCHAVGGIAITASHNPAEYNALKLCNRRGLFLNNYERGELLDLYHQSEFHHASNGEIRQVHHAGDSAKRLHLARVLQHVDGDLIRKRHFRVGLDAVNGVGSLMTPDFLREILQCELVPINIDATKPFPRDPEPKPENLGALASLVQQQNCDIGFAQDPDGDRLAVVDESGVIFDNNDVLALAVEAVLDRTPGNVVVNLTTSKVVEAVVKRFGQKVFYTPVGEANVVEGMEAAGAVIGGEGISGGIIFPALHFCRDSFIGMALILDRMARTGRTAKELRTGLPQYSRRSGKAQFEHGKLGPFMQRLEDLFADGVKDYSDGLKLTWENSWIHVRASNTEPVLRYSVEAATDAKMEKLYGVVEEALLPS